VDKHTWAKLGDSPNVSEEEELDEAVEKRSRKAGKAKKGKKIAKPTEDAMEKDKLGDDGMGGQSGDKDTAHPIPDKDEEEEDSDEGGDKPVAQRMESPLSSSEFDDEDDDEDQDDEDDDEDEDEDQDDVQLARQSSFQKCKLQYHLSIMVFFIIQYSSLRKNPWCNVKKRYVFCDSPTLRY